MEGIFMKRIYIVFCIVANVQANEKLATSGCLRRIMAKINLLFSHEPKITPYQPKSSDEEQQFTQFMREAIYHPQKLEKSVITAENILHKDRNGKTALHWIAQHSKDDSLPLMQKLIDCKADANAQAHNGQTPLMVAIHAPCAEATMRLLLASRADATIKDKKQHDIYDLIQLSDLVYNREALYGVLKINRQN
jgi:Ankyrin repeats (3 copies)